MEHLYAKVPELGDVEFSSHALAKAHKEGISETMVRDVLYDGAVVPDGMGASTVEKDGIRVVVIHRPEPFRGRKLAVTIFRVQAQKRVKYSRSK